MTYYKVKFINEDLCRVQASDQAEAEKEAREIVQGVEVLSVEAELPMKLEFYSAIYGNKLGETVI